MFGINQYCYSVTYVYFQTCVCGEGNAAVTEKSMMLFHTKKRRRMPVQVRVSCWLCCSYAMSVSYLVIEYSAVPLVVRNDYIINGAYTDVAFGTTRVNKQPKRSHTAPNTKP